jgi:acetyl-CoA synthetase
MNETNLLEDQPIAWRPTPEVIERAQLSRFMKQVGVSTWEELYEFSIRDVEKFTEEVLKFLDIKFNPPYEKLMDISGGVEFPEWFGRSSGLNITEMCLDRWQTDEMRQERAVIWEGEDGATEMFSYEELFTEVGVCAAALRQRGFGKGDAIGIHLPMTPETVVILLAINRIGAIAVPVFSGYGVEAIVSRMDAVGAKALFTSFGYHRRGKPVQSAGFEAAGKSATVETLFFVQPRHRQISIKEQEEKAREAARQAIEKFQAMTPGERAEHAERSKVEAEQRREEFFATLKEHNVPDEQINEIRQDMEQNASGAGGVSFGIYGVQSEKAPPELPFAVEHFEIMMGSRSGSGDGTAEPTSAEEPLIILYTSGTTGKPKGIAHTHASFPIKAAQDMAFGTDVGRGTRICWYTDLGWMMGPWLIYGALINGATICLYDGAPDYPTADRMWEFCAKHKVEVLGISPTLIRSLAASEATGPQASRLQAIDGRQNVNGTENGTARTPDGGLASETLAVQSRPFERHDLRSLRAFASTGEPWNPAPWWWLFENVGDSKLPIINYSGGTEISGGILMGNPLLPLKPCSFPAPCPGMDVDILDENGKPVGPGKVGELVIKQPWIGMARGFWREKERYLETYWSRFKNIWVHGDWAMRDADGHWFILGRSDDTLKVAGKRVGPAEVESILVSHPQVTEAAVIGVPDEAKGTAMVAFVVRSADTPVRAPSLAEELKVLVAKEMGKPLAPSKIHFVAALPKTRNAKVMRRVIRCAYLGEDPGDLSALENPGAVEEIAKTSAG